MTNLPLLSYSHALASRKPAVEKNLQSSNFFIHLAPPYQKVGHNSDYFRLRNRVSKIIADSTSPHVNWIDVGEP